VHELINVEGAAVEVLNGPPAWHDFLNTRQRLEVNNEPRALVVAETLATVLKRAPQTMARHYRRAETLGLRELLSRFDCQQVPEALLAYDQFAARYKGAAPDTIAAALESETDLLKLPQTIHVASAQSFDPELSRYCDEESCMVAHTFADAHYTHNREEVWLAAEVESKLAVSRELAAEWCNRLELLAARNGFTNTRLWLVSNEGFSEAAMAVLRLRHACSSNRQQVEFLSAKLGAATAIPTQSAEADEFVMILPMGEDNELVAASTVEQIARRLSFSPEAINQIKTAIVEACINAAEHSFSPDRKIYQRFRIESDRLTVTISSRGVVPAITAARSEDETSEERRGWGLKLIKTLMDEVEFERVDEGTSLKMTKYVR
jgi:serine/threonine-protein kinase RsbW